MRRKSVIQSVCFNEKLYVKIDFIVFFFVFGSIGEKKNVKRNLSIDLPYLAWYEIKLFSKKKKNNS